MNKAAQALGRIKTPRKATAARENGQKGGYWCQTRNATKRPTGINARYVSGG